MPKISVYIPTHNYGQFIAQSIESVLGQTMDDWEFDYLATIFDVENAWVPKCTR